MPDLFKAALAKNPQLHGDRRGGGERRRVPASPRASFITGVNIVGDGARRTGCSIDVTLDVVRSIVSAAFGQLRLP
jgi:hypothetical protein